MIKDVDNLPKVEPFLLEVAELVNSTLDLDTLLRRVAEIVRRVIDYEIFAILLLNERQQELRIRFAIGHPQEAIDNTRIRVGEGVTGLAALRREPVLVNDVSKDSRYIGSMPGIHSELAIPLIIKNRVIGVIDLEAPQPGYFTDEHKRWLTLIASRVAIAIENARLYTRVSRQARSLKLLNEISRDLTSILNLDQLLERIGQQLQRLLDYQIFSVLLLDSTGTKLEHRFSLRYHENIQIKHDIPIGKGLVGFAALHQTPILVADVTLDPRYIAMNPETRSELCVPLVYKGKSIGVLDIEHTRRGYFTEQHLRTMMTLAAQVAVAIENARLYERLTRQEQQMERDLVLARELQQRLLPSTRPALASAEVAARFEAAQFIGGDLYDFIPYSNGRMGIAIGDVSGKGAPAAIYAALVSGFLRSHAAIEPSAAAMMAALNHSLGERAIEAHYVCLTYAIWDDRTQQLRIANSGMPRPVYCHNGRLERVEVAGLPAGLFPEAEYDEFTFNARPGDMFVFFSDGLIDASNADGELFTRPRIEEIIARHCDRSAEEVVNAIFEAVNKHAGSEPPWDDETVVAIKVKRAGK